MPVDRLAELQERVATLPPVEEAPPPSPPPLTKKELKARRKAEKQAAKARLKNPAAVSEPVAPKDPLNMEEFFRQVDSAKAGLGRIGESCDAIERAHRVIIQSVSEADIKEQEAIISAYMDSTNKRSAEVRQTLEAMDRDTKALEPIAPRGSGDLRMRRINHAALVDRFAGLMKRLQEIQQGAASKHHSQIERQYKIMKPDADREELEEVVETVGAMTLTTQQIFSLGQSRDPLETLEAMKARRKDIMDIEKNIVILHQMFVDLGNMVEEQGAILDSLEENLAHTIAFEESAQESMVAAVESQKNIRRLKCNIL